MKKMRLLSFVLVLALVLCFPAGVAGAMDTSPKLPAGTVAPTSNGSILPDKTGLKVAGPSNDEVTRMKAYGEAHGLSGGMVGVYDLKLMMGDGAEAYSVNGSATIRVNAPTLHSYDTVKVVHETGTGTSEVINATAGEGYFTFTTNSFSLFGFVVTRGNAPTNTNNDTGSGTTARSPQTGVYA